MDENMAMLNADSVVHEHLSLNILTGELNRRGTYSSIALLYIS